MANNFISDVLKTYSINTFKNTFAVPNDLNIGLVFIGKSDEYESEPTIDVPYNVDSYRKKIWDGMVAALEIHPGDVELVIPKRDWQSSVEYKQYDDTVLVSELNAVDDANSIEPMFVYTTSGNVYKCLSNNNSVVSTVEPTGDYVTSNGFISTADGYVWKYMYNVKPTNRFLTTDWIPVPYSIDTITSETDYTVDRDSLIDGAITTIVVDDGGSGYYNTTHSNSYLSGTQTLSCGDLANVVVGMGVSGTGIPAGSYVISRNEFTSTLTINAPTTANGTEYITSTRVVISGDGIGAAATATLTDDSIEKITVTSFGSNYVYANVNIYGTSTNAVVRPVFPIKHGHGYSPALELYAKDMMIVRDINNEEAYANNFIPEDIEFRQYGILMNPHTYGSDQTITYTTANTVLIQTTNVTVSGGLPYTQYEYLYQGTTYATSTFSGFLVSEDVANNIVKLTNVRGTPSIGGLLKGNTSSVSRPISTYLNPDMEKYSGDIVYVNNTDSIARAPGQTEELRFIIKL